MSVKTYKPTTPARRNMSVSGFDGVDKKAKPERSLLEPVKKKHCNEQEIKKMGAAFGGGMATMEATCGALVGAGIALGLMKYEDKPIRSNAKQLITDFKEMSKATSCKDLKGIDTGVMLTSCEDCMKNAVKALAAQL